MDRSITRVRPGRADRSAESAEAGELSLRARARVLLIAALGPLVTGYAGVAALFAFVSAVGANARFATIDTLLAAGPGLLAVYQVPVEIGGDPLGMLPLLPTIGMCLLVARTAAGAAQRLDYHEPGQAVTVIGVITGSHALAGALIALLSTGEPFTAAPLAALLIPGVLGGLSALVGLSDRCGITATVRHYLNPVASRGMRAGAVGMAALVSAGAVTFTISLLASIPTAHDLFAAGAAGFGSGIGMLLLSVCYIPNAVVAGLGVAAGPGFSIGALSVTPFGHTPGALPGVPVLAGVPESYAAWWPALLLLPALSGAGVGWILRRCSERPLARLRAVAIAAALVAFGVVLLATLGGGRLGSGQLDSVEIPAGVLSLAAFGWIAVPGGLVAWLTGPRPALRLPGAMTAPDEEAEEPDDPEGADEPADEEALPETSDSGDDSAWADEADADETDADETDPDAEDAEADPDSDGADADGADMDAAPEERDLAEGRG